MKSDRGAREDAKLAPGGYGKLATGIPKPHGGGRGTPEGREEIARGSATGVGRFEGERDIAAGA